MGQSTKSSPVPVIPESEESRFHLISQVIEQLKDVAKGECKTPDTETRMFGNIVFAAVTLPVGKIKDLLDKFASEDSKAKGFLEDRDLSSKLMKAHVTLPHKRSHGVVAVANCGAFLKQNVLVDFTALLLFSDKLAALEAQLGSGNGEKVDSKYEWPRSPDIPPKEANTLPYLVSEGRATRIKDILQPVGTGGILDFY